MGSAHRGASRPDSERAVAPGDVVLVTGAAGLIGSVVVERLAGLGYRVVAADRAAAAGSPAERFLVGDTRDPEFVAEALHATGRAVDAVVHLAAIPSPGQVPEDLTLVHNVHGAYLVLDGAGRAGVRTAVAASSFSAYGYPWADRDLTPPYVPVDEAQPSVAIDSYGLSKTVTEEIGAFATRRWGMPTTLFRFPFVGQGARLDAYVARMLADPAEGRRDLWCWIDTRDAARVVELALTAGLDGHHVFNVAAPDTVSDVPTAELLRRFHPTTQVRRPLDGFATVVDTTAVRDALGFETVHGWRPAAVTGPESESGSGREHVATVSAG